MSGQPSESTSATYTRRRASDRRARAKSLSKIGNDRPDATVMRSEQSDSASYFRSYHRDSDLYQRTNFSLSADATLFVPQLSNPAPLGLAL